MVDDLVPPEFMDLLTRPITALVATASTSAKPSVSPIWIEYKNGHVLFSSQDTTLKRRNLAGNSYVAFCVVDPTDPYRYIELRGVVVEMSADGAHAHLDALSLRYRKESVFPGHDYSVPRSLMKVRIDRVIVQPAPVAASGD